MKPNDVNIQNKDEILPFKISESKKPMPIFFACAFGFLYLFLVFYVLIFSSSVRNSLINHYGLEFLFFLIINHLLVFISLLGIWKLKRWGIILFTFVFILSVIYIREIKLPMAWWEYAFNILFISLCLCYIRKMT